MMTITARAVPRAVVTFVLLAIGSAAPAQQLIFSGSASARVGGASNPFLEPDAQTSVYGELDIAPRLELNTPTGSTAASLRYRRTQYLEGYDGTDEFQASIAHERAVNERVRMSLEGEFSSSLAGQREFGVDLPPVDSPPLDPDLLDPESGLFGGRQRRNRFSFRSSVAIALSERANLNGANWAVRSEYGASGIGSSFWAYGGTLEYSRALGPRARGGARVTYEWTDYDNALDDDAFIWQPQLHYDRQVTSWLNVNVAAGLVLVEEQFSSGSRISTSFGGSAQACAAHERSSICAAASRDASATGSGSVRTRTNLSLTYANRFGENDQVRLGAQYSKADAARSSGPLSLQGSSSLLNLFGAAETRLNRRIALGTNLSYRRLSSAAGFNASDVNGQIFLRIFLGPQA